MFIAALAKTRHKPTSFRGCMIEQTVVYPYHGTLLSDKRKGLLIHATACVGFPGVMLSGKGNPKGYMLYGSIYTIFLM